MKRRGGAISALLGIENLLMPRQQAVSEGVQDSQECGACRAFQIEFKVTTRSRWIGNRGLYSRSDYVYASKRNKRQKLREVRHTR